MKAHVHVVYLGKTFKQIFTSKQLKVCKEQKREKISFPLFFFVTEKLKE